MTRLHNFFRKLAAALMLGTMLVPMGLAAIPHPAYAKSECESLGRRQRQLEMFKQQRDAGNSPRRQAILQSMNLSGIANCHSCCQ